VNRRVRIKIGVSTVAVAMALTACGGGGNATNAGGGSSGPSASQANSDAQLKVGFTVPTPALNPHKVVSAPAAFPYLTPIYDRLTQMKDVDGTLTLAPMVATEWAFAPDGKSATFTLRDGVTFSDGAVLDAAAVKATLDHAKNAPGSTVANYFSMIDSVNVIDPKHVEIKVNRQAADLPYVLSGVEASLISPAALDNPDLDVKPVGSGPYVATEIKIGDSASYARRDGYWEPEAQLAKTINIKGFPDGNARLNALRSGQVDIINFSVGQYAQATNLGNGFGHFAYPPSQVYSLYMNIDKPNLNNQKVRQALNFAVDREGINKSLLNGQCTPTSQPLTGPMDGFLKNPPVNYTYDKDKARSLLAEAGVTNLTIDASVGAGLSPQTDLAAALAAQFGEVGVTLNVQPSDVIEAITRYAQKGQDSMVQVRVSDPSSAQSLARNYVNPRQFPGTTPPELVSALAPAYDPSTSAKDVTVALEKASSVVNEQALDVFICAVGTQFAYSDKVIGANSMGVSHYAGYPDLRYVGLSK
jgi:peptide/nickel transport system substrate-binding protein